MFLDASACSRPNLRKSLGQLRTKITIVLGVEPDRRLMLLTCIPTRRRQQFLVPQMAFASPFACPPRPPES